VTPTPSQPLSDGQQLALLLDAISDYAIHTLDAGGFVTSWNAGAENIMGYSAEEVVGQHFARFFTAEDRSEGLPSRILAEARRIGCFESEGWRMRRDGRRFWAVDAVHAIRDPGDRFIGFARITRDVAERVAAQEALQESERRFRLLVDGVFDYAIYMLDPSGVITNWNTGAERMKGYRADEIIGRHFSLFYTPEDRAAGLPAHVLDVTRREGRFETEGWRIRKDGSRFWASVVVDAIRREDGLFLGFAKITRDISERRLAQDALRESERRFRLLVNGVTDHALYMLDPNGIVTNWNAGAQRIKGYTAAEIVGQHFSRFYIEQDRAAGVPARALYTAGHEGRFEAEGWRVRKDGSLFWANVVIEPIRDESGQLIGFVKITRDMTERREAQLALEQARAQRDRAQRMEALGQLTGSIAHDFNNLLTIVAGQAEMLKHHLGDNARAIRAVQAIEHAAERGESLTRQLLTFSRRQTLNPVVIDIKEQIERFCAMLTSSSGTVAALVTDIDNDVWRIRVDVSELELALMNIVLNARDAMPRGGNVVLRAANARLSRGDMAADLEGDFVALTLTDSGCGIAPDILPKVFDPFFTTKSPDQGSGLGLSQVHGFSHQSGGTVTIASELGRGTAITLYLPRANADPQRASADAAADSHGGGTVLLVEDNPDVAELAITLLEHLGYEVHAAPHAQGGLEMLEQRRFDLLISDVVMAGAMDGIGLAKAVRERYPSLPIILVTGHSAGLALADLKLPVLRKPFHLAELSRAATKAIAESQQPRPSNLVNLDDVRRGVLKPEP
jgi:PAS domain S-box-containing protein